MRKPANIAVSIVFLWMGLAAIGSAQDMVLRADPAKTTADFTLSDPLHTVHGSFQGKSGEIHFDASSGTISGAIIFDATTGHSGSTGRDRKMHKEVLESARFPEISFRPDRVDGKVTPTGTSTVQVHGMFAIHGSEHEIITPATVTFQADHWEASAHFPVPYTKWGMKNPSVMFLRVGDTVDIDLHLSGTVAASATSH